MSNFADWATLLIEDFHLLAAAARFKYVKNTNPEH